MGQTHLLTRAIPVVLSCVACGDLEESNRSACVEYVTTVRERCSDIGQAAVGHEADPRKELSYEEAVCAEQPAFVDCRGYYDCLTREQLCKVEPKGAEGDPESCGDWAPPGCSTDLGIRP